MTKFSLNECMKQLFSHPTLKSHGREIKLTKGSHLFTQGDNCSDVFCMRNGLIKLYFMTREGKEWIKSFVADQGIIGSRSSQLLGIPSPFSALCLEDTRIISFPYAIFEQTCMNDPELSRILFHFSQWLGLKKELREFQLLSLSAGEAYNEFLASYPDLIKRLTQIDIARYLGITPIALSRIKNHKTSSQRPAP